MSILIYSLNLGVIVEDVDIVVLLSGVIFSKRILICIFLMGLNESYSALKIHLMSLDPFPIFGKVFSPVLQEERQRSAYVNNGKNGHSVPLSEPVGMLTNASQSNFDKPKERLYRTHCGKTNHTVDKCFQLHGFPPGFGRGAPPGFGRGRGRSSEYNSPASRSVHNVSSENVNGDSGAPQVILTTDQCSQLISFLQQQMNVSFISPSQQTAPLYPSTSTQPIQPCSDPNTSFSGMFPFFSFSASNYVT